jgi:hypothetical protein
MYRNFEDDSNVFIPRQKTKDFNTNNNQKENIIQDKNHAMVVTFLAVMYRKILPHFPEEVLI